MCSGSHRARCGHDKPARPAYSRPSNRNLDPGMGMRTREQRGPRLGNSVGIMIVGALVALAGCAAQPAKTQGGATVANGQSTAPVASKPIDFHTLKETKCP